MFMKNDGAGNFNRQTTNPPILEWPADYDGDGRIDAVKIGSPAGFYLNQGGTFALSSYSMPNGNGIFGDNVFGGRL